jgi:hypothetical protein
MIDTTTARERKLEAIGARVDRIRTSMIEFAIMLPEDFTTATTTTPHHHRQHGPERHTRAIERS